MTDQHRVVLIDAGATRVKAEAVDYRLTSNAARVTSVAYQEFPTTKNPNNPVEDYARIRALLTEFRTEHGFEAIFACLAARMGRNGVIARGGSLNWHGRSLGAMLTGDFGVPSLVDNDGKMIGMYERVFGVISNKFEGRNVLVLSPGTGLATCFLEWTDTGWQFKASEVQHNPYDRQRASEGCNCGTFCFESAASGVAYQRANIDPRTLDEAEDVAMLAPPLGALVASCVRQDPSGLQLVVISGNICYLRPSLMGAVEAATTADLRGFADTPEFIMGSGDAAALRGCLAYGILANVLH